MKEAEDWHCKVFMETLMDNSNFSFLIQYKCASVLCKAHPLPFSPPFPLSLSHTYTHAYTPLLFTLIS